MKRIYLSGPMTGLPEFNFPAFAAEAERLRGLGFDVVHPAEINQDGGTCEECMRRDVALLVTCDHVATLPARKAHSWKSTSPIAWAFATALRTRLSTAQHRRCLTPTCSSSKSSNACDT